MAASRFRPEQVAAASLVLGLAGTGVSSAAQSATTPARGAPPPGRSAPSRAPASAVVPVDILEFDIDGNTVLDEATVDDAVYPFLGPHRTKHDIDLARAALEKVYVDRGFKTVAVIIPRQTVVHGVVHLQVVEGRVGHVRVVGSRFTSIVRLKQAASAFAEGTVPNFNDVQRDIVQLNQLPDTKVSPVLKAGATPGTIDVDLIVDDHLPLHGSAEVNNEQSEDTHELRTIGTLSYDNLFQLDHSLTLSYQVAPQDESDAQVEYASYLARFGASPFSLLVDGYHSSSNVTTLGTVDVLGRGQMGEIKGVLTLFSSTTSYQAVTFGVAYKHFNDQTTETAETSSPSQNSFTTPVTYFPVSVGYTALVRSRSAVTELDLSVTFASPELGSPGYPSDQGLNLSRYQANGQDLYLRENLTRTQDLPLGLQAFVRLTGQLTDQPLIPNEQFTLGGASSVRGYLEAEALADYGFTGTFELRSPQLAGVLSFGHHRLFQDLRLFGFVDGAKAAIWDPLQGQQSRFTLGSFGAGGNLQILGFLNASVTWARTAYDGPVTPRGSNKLLFRAWASF